MDPLYRIVAGELAPEELAALTLVLMARTAAGRRLGQDPHHPGRRQRRTRTRWRRLGPAGDYRSPVSWR
ncbi:acyl-CoA carboxylase subunit epsilon [Micromonospora sp. DT229]|uniref:acyl-CoA carboxylase subunit epsilon n=1 Tax=Micromonospora sp. DT229 TaxID=3393430 RepID=UPI003CF639D7